MWIRVMYLISKNKFKNYITKKMPNLKVLRIHPPHLKKIKNLTHKVKNFINDWSQSSKNAVPPNKDIQESSFHVLFISVCITTFHDFNILGSSWISYTFSSKQCTSFQESSALSFLTEGFKSNVWSDVIVATISLANLSCWFLTFLCTFKCI